MNDLARVLVVGATGGSGRATVEYLLAEGHEVTAFSRHADRLSGLSDQLTTINGDATSLDDVEKAVAGHDAVIVTLGISENPLCVRVFGPRNTAKNVRSVGTRNVIEAMVRHKVKRLVVQSTYGVGETRHRLRFMDQMFFNILLKPQIEDTEVQEIEVRKSRLDWTLAQPVHLTDEANTGRPEVSIHGAINNWKVSRQSVGCFLGQTAISPTFVHQSVALSG